MISMKSGGFLKSHNHEYGWITGSFYLKVPKYLNNDDSGKIAFSYRGPRFPTKNKKFNVDISIVYDIFADKLNISKEQIMQQKNIPSDGKIGFNF